MNASTLSTGTEPTAKPYSGAPQADTLPVSLGTGGVSAGDMKEGEGS